MFAFLKLHVSLGAFHHSNKFEVTEKKDKALQHIPRSQKHTSFKLVNTGEKPVAVKCVVAGW